MATIFHSQTVDVYENFEDATLETGLTKNDADGRMIVNDTNRYMTGTHSMSVDMTTGTTSRLEYTLSSASSVSVGFWYYTSNWASNGTQNMFLKFNGGGVMHDCITLRDELTWSAVRNISFTEFGTGINISNATWYWITVLWEAGVGGTLRVYDTSHNQVGSDITTTGSGGDNHNDTIDSINIGEFYGPNNFAGKINLDEFVIDYTNHAFPLLAWGDKTVTVRPSGGTYTSLAAAIAGELTANPDLTATGIDSNLIIQIEGDWSGGADSPAATVTLSGFTNDATHYPVIKTDAANRAGTTWDTSKYRLSVNAPWGNVGLAISQNYGQVIGLQISSLHAHSGAVVSSNSHGNIIDSCLIANTSEDDVGALVINGGGTVAPCTVRNCIVANIINAGGGGAGIYVWGTTNLTVDNCTVVNCGGAGINIDTSTSTVVTNCYSGGNTGADFAGAAGTLTTCRSEDGTRSTSTVAYSTSTFTNVTDNTEDLSLVGGSGLIDIGTDLHSRGSFPFSIDIKGTARPNGVWDIGAFEYILPIYHGQTVDLYENFEDATLDPRITKVDASSHIVIPDATWRPNSMSLNLEGVVESFSAHLEIPVGIYANMSVGFWYRTPNYTINGELATMIHCRDSAFQRAFELMSTRAFSTINYIGINLTDGGVDTTQGIVVSPNTDYWVTARWRAGVGCDLSIYSSTFTLVGSWSNIAPNARNIEVIHIGERYHYGGEAGTYSRYDDLLLDWTNVTYPLLAWDTQSEDFTVIKTTKMLFS